MTVAARCLSLAALCLSLAALCLSLAALCLSLAALCLSLAFGGAQAQAATAYVDGVSDQSLPAWDGGFSEGYFGRLFSAVWVTGGHVKLARYVAQWDLMREDTNGANPHGDYRERLEAWLTDVGSLGLVPDVALTSYDGNYPEAGKEYETRLRQLLDRARAMGHPIQYVEAWNEPNNQGELPALEAASLTNSAQALCAQGYGCTVIAGNLEDSPNVGTYEREYESALHPLPAIWGVHPYHSVEHESEAPLLNFVRNLPHNGAGEQVWFTEIAARVCTNYGGHLLENGEVGQANRTRWLVDTLMRNRRPEHVFYYAFLLGDRREPSCSSATEDGALYEPSTDPGAPDVPRPAASYVFDGEAHALDRGCDEAMAFARYAGGELRAIRWSTPGQETGWSLPVLANGCTTLTGTSTATFIP